MADAAPVNELDFARVLAGVAGRNPQVAFAEARYREAYAQWEAARILWLPSIRAGVSYHKHEGALQDVIGNVFDVDRSALQSGLGVGATAAGTTPIPGVIATFDTTDAVFQPKIAGCTAAAERAAVSATTNRLLLEAALAYLALLEAAQLQAITAETLHNSQQLADLTGSYAQSGQGLAADADRARADLMLRRIAVTQAEEQLRVATSRVNQLLRLDPCATIAPVEASVVPVELVARDLPLGQLLAAGLTHRPELAESRHLVSAAINRYRREQWSPLLPSAVLAGSYSTFGGGIGAELNDFGDRLDVDAITYWEVRNLGIGERTARDQARAQWRQTQVEQIRRMDEVAQQIVAAHAQVQSRNAQIATAQDAVLSATDSLRRNLERIRDGEGLPIEALQSVQALDQARREYLRVVTSYNEAQFQLQWALGWPSR